MENINYINAGNSLETSQISQVLSKESQQRQVQKEMSVQENISIQEKIIQRTKKIDESKETGKKLKVDENVDITKLISKVNDFVQSVSTKISFTYDEESDIPIIKVIDKETDNVVRQIPPKEMIELSKKMDELTGIIYRGTA